jgi:hypothetical protein
MARRRTQVDRKAAKAEQRRDVRTSPAEHPLLALQRSAGNSAVTESLLARDGAKAPPKKEEPKSGTDYTVTIEGVGEFKALSFSYKGKNEVIVTKETDELSTALMKLMLNGTSLKVVITAAHMTLTLEGAMISGYNVSSGGEKPMETLTFNFTDEKIEYHSGDSDDDGRPSTGYP